MWYNKTVAAQRTQPQRRITLCQKVKGKYEGAIYNPNVNTSVASPPKHKRSINVLQPQGLTL